VPRTIISYFFKSLSSYYFASDGLKKIGSESRDINQSNILRISKNTDFQK